MYTQVFRALRLLWGIQDAEYMLSIAGSSALRQLNSPGKSGCMFFLSDDQKFLVKTMRKSEIHTLIAMLPEVRHTLYTFCTPHVKSVPCRKPHACGAAARQTWKDM